MRAAIYCPSWDYAGGGEKNMAVIAELLVSSGWEVVLAGEVLPDVGRLEQVLNVNLAGCTTLQVSSQIGPVLSRLARFAPRPSRLLHARRSMNWSRQFDLLVYITGEIPPLCHARKGFLFIQFPYNREEAVRVDASGAPLRLADREKLIRLRSWHALTCPSHFVRESTYKRWQVNPEVLYPPAEIEPCKPGNKQPFILTVGRFYATGPTKKHAVMVEAFRQMCDEGLAEGWSLKVAGGVHPREDHQRYLQEVKELAAGYPIEILTDLTFSQVLPLYSNASIYWHATGAGEDVSERPELFEQFGMTIVEAMASGATPVVIDGGGPAEIVRRDVDGFHWHDIGDLKSATLRLMRDTALLGQMSERAMMRAAEFSRKRYEEQVADIVARLSSSTGAAGAPAGTR